MERDRQEEPRQREYQSVSSIMPRSRSPVRAPPPATSVPSAPASSRQRRGRRQYAVPVPPECVLTFSPYEPGETATSSPMPPRRAHATPSRVRRREMFVQGNHRFALNPDRAPASSHMVLEAVRDADAPLDWDAVELVFVERCDEDERAQSCPICLETLRCPKITPCGHVFDHVCILQHLHYAGSERGKCPLCSSIFHKDSLKSVAFRMVGSVRITQTVTMQLVCGMTKATVAVPYSDTATHDIPVNVNEHSQLFTRLVYASEDYLLDILRQMANDLRATLAEEPSLKPFVDFAIGEVKEKRNNVRWRRSRRRRAAWAAENDRASSLSTEVSDSSESPMTIGISAPTSKEDLRFFYQSQDAQNVYLHPVNHRCLLYEYDNDLTSAPRKVQADILDVERYTMDEVLRKRYRFLRHLPEGCEFMFVELDLKPVLTGATLAHFGAELAAREAARQKRREENARESQLVDKQQTESLQDYFRVASAYRNMNPNIPVDRNDESSFPALGVDIPGARASSAEVPTGVSPGSAWGGAEISSYSSVTSNMGLFPALGAGAGGPALTTAPTPPFHHSPPRGAWATTNATGLAGNEQNASTAQEVEPRRTRKQNGRQTFTVVSSSGSPYRR